MKMNSPATALAWEIWRKNRWVLMPVVAAIPAGFLVWAMFGTWIPEMVQISEFFLVLLSAVSIFWVFSFTELDARGRHSGFPSRLFVLPVRTVKLVSYPVLYGIFSILVFYFLWVGAISAQWKVKLPWAVMVCQATVLAAMMVSMQAVVWALHRFNWTRMVFLMLGETLLACCFGFAVERSTSGWLSCQGLTILSGSIGLLAYFGAFIAVEQDRRGEWLTGLETACQSLLGLLPHRGKPFASKPAAQFWMEWRRRGWFTACTLAFVMACSLAVLPMAKALYLDSPMMQINLFILPLTTLWFAACAGMNLGKSDVWSPELALHPITSTRPITTGEIVMAKLKVAATIAVFSSICFAVLAFPAMQAVRLLGRWNDEVLQFWANFPSEHRTLLRWATNPVVMLTALGLTWHATVQGMCPVLAGRIRKNVWAVGLGLSFFGVAVLVMGWLLRHPERFPAFLEVLPWITAALLVWKWSMAARVFMKVYRGRLFSRKQRWWLLGLWGAVTAGVSISACLACVAHEIPTPIIFFLAVLVLPGGALAECAENLAQNRHR